MKLFGKHHDKNKVVLPPPPTFTDEELGIKPSPAEEETAILEKKQEAATRIWHSEKPTYQARSLDIITNDIVRRQQRN